MKLMEVWITFLL